MKTPATYSLSERTVKGHAEDAAELDGFLKEQDPVDLMAAHWLSQQEEGLDAAQMQAFDAWLAADPAHRHAFNSLMVMMGKVADIPRPSLQVPAQPVSPAAGTSRTWLSGMRNVGWRWPRGLAYCLMLAIMCLAGWHTVQQKEIFAATYATARSEQRDITLPDNSKIALDTMTTVNVSFTDNKRSVELPEGQAYFNVAAKGHMPFEVLAGQARITVVGTRFSVRYTRDGINPDMTHLAVEEGHVRIARNSWWPWSSQVDLHAGDTITMGKNGQLGDIQHHDDGIQIMPWRIGRVDFDNVPLSQALAEFERYGDTHVVIRDPKIAQLRIQGSFDLQRIDAFMRALPQVLPVYGIAHGQAVELMGAPEVGIK